MSRVMPAHYTALQRNASHHCSSMEGNNTLGPQADFMTFDSNRKEIKGKDFVFLNLVHVYPEFLVKFI